MIEISDGVFFLRFDDSRKTFDSIFPTKRGTTYNSYIVVGSDKTALIDTVDPSKREELYQEIKSMGIKIDYIISNHSEQDHSGSIPFILEKFPEAKVVTNQLGKNILTDLLGIDEDKFIITDRLDLGGKTLRFINFPWAHWPETMMTFYEEKGILFTCDVFGAHYMSKDFYDDSVEEYSKQYFAEIMLPFRKIISKNLENLPKEISMICPSHGPVHKEPEEIISLYKKWITGGNKVTILYATMHGDTEKIAKKMKSELDKKGIDNQMVNVSNFDISDLFKSVLNTSILIVATPTVLGNAHPSVLLSSSLISAYKPDIKKVALVVLYEWGSFADKSLSDIFKQYDVFQTLKLKGASTKGIDDFIKNIEIELKR